MQELMDDLIECYSCSKCAIIPGSGKYGMEAVARQYANSETNVLIIRNGYFSYRWSQIFDAGKIPMKEVVCKATLLNDETHQISPKSIDEVVEEIKALKPSLVCLPHVETSVGVLVNDDYIKKLAEAVHAVGGLLC